MGDIGDIVDGASEFDPDDELENGERETQASALIRIGHTAQLFRSPDGELYAHGAVNGHFETWHLGTTFKRWLIGRYFGETARAPNPGAVTQAMGVLEGSAQFSGLVHDVHVRIAEAEGLLFVDLGDDSWRTVRIGPEGWSVINRAPVRFRRPKGQKPLPAPEPGGSLEELRHFLNVREESDWQLVIAWLVGCFHPFGPYPLLLLHGEAGAAKSSASRYLRGLVDPAVGGARDAPKDPRDLAVAAKNARVLAYDNLSSVPAWLADAFCRLATGSGFATRALYTDDEEAIFDARRPIIINSIEEIATRGDMLDRAISTVMQRVEHPARESALNRSYDEARPRLLGALCDIVSRALRDYGKDELPSLPRMADFAAWVIAAEPALGWAPGSFMAAYSRNQGDAVELELEAAAIGPALLAFLENRTEWRGTATELLSELATRSTEDAKKRKGWPGNGRALSGALKRLGPALRRSRGWIVIDRRAKTTRYLAFTREVNGDAKGDANPPDGDSFASPGLPFASPDSANSEIAGDAGDANDAHLPTPNMAPSKPSGEEKKGDEESTGNFASPASPDRCTECGGQLNRNDIASKLGMHLDCRRPWKEEV
jgi:hypothetical protein